MHCLFETIREDVPGLRWQRMFYQRWPSYCRWYLRDGHHSRPSYLACRRALKTHMPELMPIYEQLTALAGGGDLEARFLSLWCPPSYITGCTQAIWHDPQGIEMPMLIRNYDYVPSLLEGTWFATRWCGQSVLVMSDCLWGALDGINESGLAASLAFGGSREVGEGFGIPLVLRYVLEVATNTATAIEILKRIPVHMTYNISLLDQSGEWATVFLKPNASAEVLRQQVVANHQHAILWPAHARATKTIERATTLESVVKKSYQSQSVEKALLRPPLFQTAYHKGYGTLYTARYNPYALTAELLWPNQRWLQHCQDVKEASFWVDFTNSY
ncbi:MAG: C45 family autoproteolytic acyltransferase/hydrolase [Acinetobacter sp.]